MSYTALYVCETQTTTSRSHWEVVENFQESDGTWSSTPITIAADELEALATAATLNRIREIYQATQQECECV